MTPPFATGFATRSATRSAVRLGRLVLAVSLLGFPLPSLAQGCSQCLDSTRATPPSVQAAYRHAIFLLGGAGSALFLGGACLLRRGR